MRATMKATLTFLVTFGLVVAAPGCKPVSKDPPNKETKKAPEPKPQKQPKVTRAQRRPDKAFALSYTAPAPAVGTSFASITSPKVRNLLLSHTQQALSSSTAPVATPAPLSLTASDGAGLELVAMKARAVVEGPLAFTELHLTFRNPRPRMIEGRFAITLPARAAISRLAMKLPDGWQEAEIVERQAARQAYEDVLHRGQDPALMEKKAGNEFRARIFPIPANSEKEIKISYSQQLTASNKPYRLHLRGLPRMKKLSIVAFLSKSDQGRASSSLGGTQLTQKVIRVDRANYEPDRDFEVKPEHAVRGLRSGNLVLARFKPELSAQKAVIKQGLLVLLDTSASRAAGFAAQVRKLGQLIEKLRWNHGTHRKLKVACFDQVLSEVYNGTLGGFGHRQLEQILTRRALGASDLHGALTWAQGAEGFDRLLLVTDGVITAGKTEGDQLRAAARVLRRNVKRMDLLLVGGIRDEELAPRLVRGTLTEDGVVLDGEAPAALLAQRMSQTTRSGVEVDIPGAAWVWPSRLDGLQPQDEVLIFADLPPGKLPAGKPLTVNLKGGLKQQLKINLAQVKRPLLERQWVRARIERLEHLRDTAGVSEQEQGKIANQIVDLSMTYRVLCDRTALLVLESEADYRRYGIGRRALAQILTVGPGGIVLQKRGKPIYARQSPPPIRRIRRRGRPTASPSGGAPPPAAASAADRLRAGAGVRLSRNAAPSVTAPPPPPAPRVQTKRLRSLAEAKVPRRPRRRFARARRYPKLAAYTGRIAKVMKLLKRKKTDAAVIESLKWRDEKPGDVLALVALGESLTRLDRKLLAARVYGSIIDLFPSRADMRRFAGQRLEGLGKAGQHLAADTFAEAARQRPDHPNSHRMLAHALVQLGKPKLAFHALVKGLQRRYPSGRFRAVREIMLEDLGLIASAWLKAAPGTREEVLKLLREHGAKLPEGGSLRFLLSWETDANDVDFHIRDGKRGHAFFRSKELPSGGRLYADVTNGYGPECFAIKGKPKAFPYRLQIHYYSRGPMGYGMGRLLIVQHDGVGGLKYEHRPFIVMNDRAYVDLGKVGKLL